MRDSAGIAGEQVQPQGAGHCCRGCMRSARCADPWGKSRPAGRPARYRHAHDHNFSTLFPLVPSSSYLIEPAAASSGESLLSRRGSLKAPAPLQQSARSMAGHTQQTSSCAQANQQGTSQKQAIAKCKNLYHKAQHAQQVQRAAAWCNCEEQGRALRCRAGSLHKQQAGNKHCS